MKKILVLVLIFHVICLPLYADTERNPLRKLSRGLCNILTGFAEIPRQVIRETSENGDIVGVFWGVPKGIACSVGREFYGVYEVATFLLPPYQTFVEPEFLFEDDIESEQERL